MRFSALHDGGCSSKPKRMGNVASHSGLDFMAIFWNAGISLFIIWQAKVKYHLAKGRYLVFIIVHILFKGNQCPILDMAQVCVAVLRSKFLHSLQIPPFPSCTGH